MDPKQIANQMIKLNKTAVGNSFNIMEMVQEQTEKMVETFLNQATWVPEEGRKAIGDWLSAYRNGCDDFKKMIDDNYAKVEAYFGKA